MKSHIILSLFLLKLYISSKIITFPFKFQTIQSNSYSYNSSTFLNENLKKNLIIELNIGTPPKKINAELTSESACFKFPLSYQNIPQNYYPNESSTFGLKQKVNSFPYYEDAYDLFSFGNNNDETYNISFAIEQSNKIFLSNKSFTPSIGLNMPTLIGSYMFKCSCFLFDLYNKKAIDKKIFSVKFNNKYDGQLIIGEDLTRYDSVHRKGKYISNYFFYKFSFNYDSVFSKSSFNKIEYMNITGDYQNYRTASINLNLGLIIGTEDFKNFIHNNFFEYLVKKKICQIELGKYEEKEYYIYVCYRLKVAGEANPRHPGTNYYEQFPNIYIKSKQFEYNFELTKKDLFEQVFDKYYFLIIFPKKYDDKEKHSWILGQPFYKKYPFTINLDASTIGFYLYNNTENDENNNSKNGIIDTQEKDKNLKNNIKIKDIIIKIGEIFVVILLLFGAYFIGMKVKEGRRKRANELNDDSYEYISDNKKDINEGDNFNKNNKFVELNSRLGL